MFVKSISECRTQNARISNFQRERDSKTRPNLCAKDRRRAIMKLPRGSGLAVLKAFDARALTGVMRPAAELEAFLQKELEVLVAARWRADCHRLWLAVAPHVPARAFLLPKKASPEAMAAWYRQTYNAQAQRDAQIAAQDWTGGFHRSNGDHCARQQPPALHTNAKPAARPSGCRGF